MPGLLIKKPNKRVFHRHRTFKFKLDITEEQSTKSVILLQEKQEAYHKGQSQYLSLHDCQGKLK